MTKKLLPAYLLLAVAFVFTFNCEAISNNSKNKGNSTIVYVDVEINQPNVNNCYLTSVSFIDAETEIKLYPNPNHGVFNLEIKKVKTSEDIIIDVYNLSGNKVFNTNKKPLGDNVNMLLNLEFLQKGVYVIHIKINGSIHVRNLILF